jgi:hypothetical protein
MDDEKLIQSNVHALAAARAMASTQMDCAYACDGTVKYWCKRGTAMGYVVQHLDLTCDRCRKCVDSVGTLSVLSSAKSGRPFFFFDIRSPYMHQAAIVSWRGS